MLVSSAKRMIVFLFLSLRDVLICEYVNDKHLSKCKSNSEDQSEWELSVSKG